MYFVHANADSESGFLNFSCAWFLIAGKLLDWICRSSHCLARAWQSSWTKRFGKSTLKVICKLHRGTNSDHISMKGMLIRMMMMMLLLLLVMAIMMIMIIFMMMISDEGETYHDDDHDGWWWLMIVFLVVVVAVIGAQSIVGRGNWWS